jgi:hypothetical protein
VPAEHLVGRHKEQEARYDRHARERAKDRQQQQDDTEGAVAEAPHQPLERHVPGGRGAEQAVQHEHLQLKPCLWVSTEAMEDQGPRASRDGDAAPVVRAGNLRTTPLLLGLYSVVTLYVHQNAERLTLAPRRAAWYPKPAATFADALARLRQHFWFERIAMSAVSTDMTEPISPAIRRISEAVCYAP